MSKGKERPNQVQGQIRGQERQRPWVLFGMDRWPVIGRLVRRDMEKFLKEQNQKPTS